MAALAIVSPVWNIIYSLGLLMEVGGSVLFSTLQGEPGQNQKKSNVYFTVAVIGVVVLAVITWLAVVFLTVDCCFCLGQGKLAIGGFSGNTCVITDNDKIRTLISEAKKHQGFMVICESLVFCCYCCSVSVYSPKSFSTEASLTQRTKIFAASSISSGEGNVGAMRILESSGSFP